jgi:hypothetical protein
LILLRRPTIYQTISPLKEEELENKELEFDGFAQITGIKIEQVNFQMTPKLDMFATDEG